MHIILCVETIHTGCPRELFPLFVCIIIFYRTGADNFSYIDLKTYISSFKTCNETLLTSEYNRRYELNTFKPFQCTEYP